MLTVLFLILGVVILIALVGAYLLYRAARGVSNVVRSTFDDSYRRPSYRDESNSTTYVPIPYSPPTTSSWEPSYTPSSSSSDDSSSSYSSSDSSSSSSDSGFSGGDSGGGGSSSDW